MKKVHSGQIEGILSWKLDRLARNPLDGSALIWALDQGKVKEIITPHQTFQNTSNDKFNMQLEFGMAKKYVDDLSDNGKRGNRAKLERGWLPGLPPLGYLNDPKDRTIVKDSERFLLVRKMWDFLLSGTLPCEIRRIANEEWGFRTRSYGKLGGRPLVTSALYKVFANPFYYGLIQRKEGVFRGRHEPMISKAEFEKAQRILGRKGRARPQRHSFAYTGLIRCGECGSMITAEEKDNRYGTHYVYYRCSKKKKGVTCSQRYVNLKALEEQIDEILERIYVPESLLRIGLRHLKEESKQAVEREEKAREGASKALSACEKKLENLNHMRLSELIDDAEYFKEKRKLLDEKLSLEENSLNPTSREKRAREATEKTLKYANRATRRFRRTSLEDKRAMLESIGSNFSRADRKLLMQAEKPFLILEEGLRAVNEGNSPLEPANLGLDQINEEPNASFIPLWCACVEDVRTFFLRNGAEQ